MNIDKQVACCFTGHRDIPHGILQVEQPKVETEIKIGNTTYIVSGYYASTGLTASEKIKRLLDKETK